MLPIFLKEIRNSYQVFNKCTLKYAQHVKKTGPIALCKKLKKNICNHLFSNNWPTFFKQLLFLHSRPSMFYLGILFFLTCVNQFRIWFKSNYDLNFFRRWFHNRWRHLSLEIKWFRSIREESVFARWFRAVRLTCWEMRCQNEYRKL